MDVQQDDATEDEYFEQELLDFLQIIASLKIKLNNASITSIGIEPIEELECIITRFNKIDFPMPNDQWTRVYDGLKSLSQMITKKTKLFESWKLLKPLYETGKKFRKKYPTAQSGEIARQKNKQNQNGVDIKMKEHVPHSKIAMQPKQKMMVKPPIKQSKIKKSIKTEVLSLLSLTILVLFSIWSYFVQFHRHSSHSSYYLSFFLFKHSHYHHHKIIIRRQQIHRHQTSN